MPSATIHLNETNTIMTNITPVSCTRDPADPSKAVCRIAYSPTHRATVRASILTDEWNSDDLSDLGRHLAEQRAVTGKSSVLLSRSWN